MAVFTIFLSLFLPACRYDKDAVAQCDVAQATHTNNIFMFEMRREPAIEQFEAWRKLIVATNVDMAH